MGIAWLLVVDTAWILPSLIFYETFCAADDGFEITFFVFL